jgi:hypothetical protein
MEATLKTTDAAELRLLLPGPLQQLREGEKGIQPLHWDLVFPDVFDRNNPGFDVFVGNPPFAGNNTFIQGYPEGILDWLKQLHPESGGQCDLVAHFFRRCFKLSRHGGALGLIATNTIAQGDTRNSGLRWICLNSGTIYAVRKRYKWPGVAAVVVSVVHLLKGAYAGVKLLDKQAVQQITAFLFANGGHDDPKQLATNSGKSFLGSKTYGQGFIFDDSGDADNETVGIPSPIATMERLLTERPKSAEVIFTYVGGEEINSSPTHAHHRYVIDFGERSEDLCRLEWPELMAIIECKVKPERDLNNREGYRRYWWHLGEKRPGLYRALRVCDRVLVIPRVSMRYAPAVICAGSVFSEQLVVFPIANWTYLLPLFTQVHELWFTFRASTFGSADAPRYASNDIFETFPFPPALLDSTANDPAQESTRQNLESIGERYHKFRAQLMVANNEGLTSTYNRFHDPAETSSDLLELRILHGEMDQAVLNAYCWSDVAPPGPLNSPCGFGLDYLDLEDDAQLPDALQERIDSGELFFWEADVACAFEAQIRAYGAVKGKKKLPWRYRWPDDVRDDVLARLLALNAERYGEEVALGLHGKGGKQGVKAGKRRGRLAKASQVGETGDDHSEQMGLGL